MKTIKLHGSLGEKYGKEFKLEVKSPAEAIKFISYQVDGFAEDLKASDWRVTKTRDGKEVDLDEDTIPIGTVANEFNFYPVVAGAKSGAAKIIGGIALVALAVATGGAGLAVAGMTISAGTIATVGVGLALAGLATTLAPEFNAGQQDSVARNPSALFEGPLNTSGSGRTIPLIYGKRVKAGSVIISSGITTERLDI